MSEILGDYTQDPDFWRYTVRCLEPGCPLQKPVKARYAESVTAVGENHTAATGHKTVVERTDA